MSALLKNIVYQRQGTHRVQTLKEGKCFNAYYIGLRTYENRFLLKNNQMTYSRFFNISKNTYL